MRLKAAIIADDLTGALDTAAPFAARGMKVATALSPTAISAALSSGAEIVAVNTASREGSAQAAAQAVRAAADAIREARPHIVFKKVDSRLKGHPGPETEALMSAMGLHEALACPAIPDLGRTVSGGRLMGFGVPEPIDVASRLEPVPARIADAADAADLLTVADEILSAGSLAIGARGLADALAHRMSGGRPPEDPSPLPHPVLIGIGSRDPITLAQVESLRPVLPEDAIGHAPNGALDSGWTPGTPIILILAQAGLEPAESTEVAARMADAIVCLHRQLHPASLVLSGGETATAVLRALAVELLEVHGEILPGLPISTFRSDGRICTLVTKSGGFGAPDTLKRLIGSTG